MYIFECNTVRYRTIPAPIVLTFFGSIRKYNIVCFSFLLFVWRVRKLSIYNIHIVGDWNVLLRVFTDEEVIVVLWWINFKARGGFSHILSWLHIGVRVSLWVELHVYLREGSIFEMAKIHSYGWGVLASKDSVNLGPCLESRDNEQSSIFVSYSSLSILTHTPCFVDMARVITYLHHVFICRLKWVIYNICCLPTNDSFMRDVVQEM